MIILCIIFYGVSVCDGSVQTFIKAIGERVTLPCRYSVETYGPSSVCWGRAEVPVFKCKTTIVSTDGGEVNFRALGRYRLESGVATGDVSLTIINVTEKDSGIYGCRVEIPGPFNDLKENFHLIITKAPVSINDLPVRTTTTTTTTTTPVHSPTTEQEEQMNPTAATGGWDSPVVAVVAAQEMNFKGNAIRMGAVIFTPLLVLTVILGLKCSRQGKCRSVGWDPSTSAV
ncbi:T-cell immunoglobulin and mucin domain-containing protein 4-like [Megalops cyprinoides]|uniref:T-cell immunoglobulin and mucin domain-containing protein 4-like n=1 Tax=Megalops cyprinoides TaxID=118141 RepID=UPI0018645E68|nr:T-cell immunoglobulin and mucin domain-containing protein 4-like [Megalops cyprinoides]